MEQRSRCVFWLFPEAGSHSLWLPPKRALETCAQQDPRGPRRKSQGLGYPRDLGLPGSGTVHARVMPQRHHTTSQGNAGPKQVSDREDGAWHWVRPALVQQDGGWVSGGCQWVGDGSMDI